MAPLSLTAALVALFAFAYRQNVHAQSQTLPPQAVMVEPSSFAVMGPNGSFRTDAFTTFNPTNTAAPFFQVFHPDFLKVIGPNASIARIAFNPDFAFAHEAPIWVERTNEVTFASNDGGALGGNDINQNSRVSKINLTEAEGMLASTNSLDINTTVTILELPDNVQMTNGGTGPLGDDLVLITSGRGNLPPSIVLANPEPPFNTTVLLDNFFGRQFNSLNDIKIHPKSGAFFFTDVTYGWLNHFRPLPNMPNQVYRLDPKTRAVRVVADGFDRCNGIAFSQDGKNAFILDTGGSGGFLGNNGTEPATIYKFDVEKGTQAFINRRVFAYVDTGVPDGVQIDTNGNLYAGCGDGTQVFNPNGELIGKIFLNTVSANHIFAGEGQLVIMAETAIYLARINASGFSLGGPNSS